MYNYFVLLGMVVMVAINIIGCHNFVVVIVAVSLLVKEFLIGYCC